MPNKKRREARPSDLATTGPALEGLREPHTSGTPCAAADIPLRTLQEWMGHKDAKTTQVYADYAPSEHEGALVERAFQGPIQGPILSKTEAISDDSNRMNKRFSTPADPPIHGLITRRSRVRIPPPLARLLARGRSKEECLADLRRFDRELPAGETRTQKRYLGFSVQHRLARRAASKATGASGS